MSDPSPESLAAAERICGMFDVGTRWTNFDDTEHGFTPAPVDTVAFAIDAAYAERLERLERIAEAAAALESAHTRYMVAGTTTARTSWREECEEKLLALFAALDADTPTKGGDA